MSQLSFLSVVCSIAIFSPLTVVFSSAQAARESGTKLSVSVAIKATCHLSINTGSEGLSNTVQLGDIPAAEFKVAESGANLNEYAKSFDLEANCYGRPSSYKYTFEARDANRCIPTNRSFINFCLKTEDGTNIDFDGGKAVHQIQVGSNEIIEKKITRITVTPQKGVGEVIVGEIAATMIVTISLK